VVLLLALLQWLPGGGPTDDEVARAYAAQLGVQDRQAALRLYRAAHAALGPIASDARVRRAVTLDVTRRGADAFVGDEATRGIARLPASALDTWNRLRGAIADATADACVELGARSSDPRRIGPALVRLADDDLGAWFALLAQAARLELDGDVAPRIDPMALTEGDDAIASMAAPDDAAFLREARGAAMLDATSACRLTRLSIAGAARLPPDLRERYLRAIAQHD
jgi:hypothetical protein